MAEYLHGFTTRDEWKIYFDNYFKKIDEIEQMTFILNDEDKNFNEWFHARKRRANMIHEIYINNDHYLNRHVYYFLNHEENWSIEIADALLSYLFRYCTRFQDVEIAYKISLSLHRYYEEKGDDIAVMKCYLVIVSCYVFLDAIHFNKKILDLCRRGILIYEKYYQTLTEEDKSLGLSLYDFESVGLYELSTFEGDISDYFESTLYKTYVARISAIDRFISAADMEHDVNKVLPYMKRCWVNTFSALITSINKNQLTYKQIEVLYNIAELQSHEDKSEIGEIGVIINKAIFLICQYQKGELTGEEILVYIYQCFPFIPDEQVKTKEAFQDEIWNVLCLFSRMIDIVDAPVEKKEAIVKILLKRVSNICFMMFTYSNLEHVLDLQIYMYIIPLLKYYQNEDEVFLMLMKFTVLRQAQTAVHSIMVSKLACQITSYILQEQPRILVPNVPTSNERFYVYKDKIMGFVKKSALLHDTGKILCSAVINMQYRKLIPLEYETIQYHPITSYKILNQIPKLSLYSDIAVGHHKFYNGEAGYPSSYNNLDFSNKIYIDLITICDSLDAATDTLGRIYAPAKSFDAVLQEFIRDKGTRYSPNIIDFIASSKDLQKDLMEILDNGRKDTYRYIYDLLVEA